MGSRLQPTVWKQDVVKHTVVSLTLLAVMVRETEQPTRQSVTVVCAPEQEDELLEELLSSSSSSSPSSSLCGSGQSPEILMPKILIHGKLNVGK